MLKIPEITIKNTKAELFQAFQEMKEKFEEKQKNQLPLPQTASLKRDETKILEKTKNLLPEKLEDEIASLNKKIQSNLADVKNELIAESEKLFEIRKAIGIESKKLEEVYNIKLAENTLQTLIADFEAKSKEMEKKKNLEETAADEETVAKKKTRERDEEEYQYQLKIQRKKEQDEYELAQAKKRAEWQDKLGKKIIELDEREQSINSRLGETENMKKEIESFPKKLEAAEKAARQEIQKELEKDFAIQKKITETQWSSEKKMFEAKINGLAETIKSQSAEAAVLKKSLSEANQRAQNLAIAIVQNTTGLKLPKNEATELSQLKDADPDVVKF